MFTTIIGEASVVLQQCVANELDDKHAIMVFILTLVQIDCITI